MESKEKVELLQRAIKQLLIEEEKGSAKRVDDHDDGHHLPLLSKLLSQLDSLKEDGMPEKLKELAATKELHRSEISEKSVTANEVGNGGSEIIQNEEIIKELREVKKQNSITHRLLSVMIVLTLAWQLSEVSLILKFKEGLSNPFKSIGSMITGMFKGPAVNSQELMKDAAAKQKQFVQAYSLPGVKVPELPHVFFSDEE